jgi:hypothetical protein
MSFMSDASDDRAAQVIIEMVADLDAAAMDSLEASVMRAFGDDLGAWPRAIAERWGQLGVGDTPDGMMGRWLKLAFETYVRRVSNMRGRPFLDEHDLRVWLGVEAAILAVGSSDAETLARPWWQVVAPVLN